MRSPLDLRRPSVAPSLLLLLLLLGIGCRAVDRTPLQDLTDALSLWESAGSDDYDYVYSPSCECPEEVYRPKSVRVRGGSVVGVEYADGGGGGAAAAVPDDVAGSVHTVAGLFDAIRGAIDGGAASVRVTYDPSLGYPASVYVDYDAAAADEELMVSITDLVLDPDGAAGAGEDPQAELDGARALWEGLGIPNYRYRYHKTCFCVTEHRQPLVVEVRDGAVASVAFAADAEVGGTVPDGVAAGVPTVDGLFDIVQDAIDRAADSVRVEYDPQYGLPVDVAIDYETMVADDELYVTAGEVEELEPTPAQHRARLDAAVAKWESRGLEDYDYLYRSVCFCPPEYAQFMAVEVRGGNVSSVSYAADYDDGTYSGSDLPEGLRVMTVPQLFGTVRSAVDSSAHRVDVAYHADLGHPMDVYIDYEEDVADEEFIAEVRDLGPASSSAEGPAPTSGPTTNAGGTVPAPTSSAPPPAAAPTAAPSPPPPTRAPTSAPTYEPTAGSAPRGGALCVVPSILSALISHLILA